MLGEAFPKDGQQGDETFGGFLSSALHRSTCKCRPAVPDKIGLEPDAMQPGPPAVSILHAHAYIYFSIVCSYTVQTYPARGHGVSGREPRATDPRR